MFMVEGRKRFVVNYSNNANFINVCVLVIRGLLVKVGAALLVRELFEFRRYRACRGCLGCRL